MSRRPSLTVLTVAHEEDESFDRWLSSFLPWATDVIVVDNSPGQHESAAMAATDRQMLVLEVDESAAVDADLGILRNTGLERVTTEWVLVLDSDEFLTDAGRRELLAHLHSGDVDCWFMPWVTTRRSPPQVVRDYKLSVFRPSSGLRYTEAIHQSVTPLARRSALSADLAPVTIEHRPREARRARKRAAYLRQLEAAWQHQPCVRIQWFLALSYAAVGRPTDALDVALQPVHVHARSHPVEAFDLLCLASVLTPDPAARSMLEARARAALAALGGDLEMVALRHQGHVRALESGRLTLESLLESNYCL